MSEKSSSEWSNELPEELQQKRKITPEDLNNEVQNLREQIRTTQNSQVKQWAHFKLGAFYFELGELSRQQSDEPNEHNEYLEQAIEDYTEAYKIDSNISSYEPITYFAYQVDCIFQDENRAKAFKIFRDLLEDIIDVKKELFQRRDGEIIHYTSEEVCNALVLGRKPFRFYNTEGMNDINEGRAFFEVMEQLGLDFPDLENLLYRGNGNPSPAYAASFIKPTDDVDAQYMEEKYGPVHINCKHGTAFSSIPLGSLYSIVVNMVQTLPKNEFNIYSETVPPLYRIFYVGDDRDPAENAHLLKTRLPLLVEHLRCFRRFYKEFSKNSGTREPLIRLVQELLDEIRFLFKSGKWKKENEVRALWMRYDQNSDDIKTDCKKGRKYIDALRGLSCTEVGLGQGVENPDEYAEQLRQSNPGLVVKKI